MMTSSYSAYHDMEILIVVASLVHCCAIKKNVIVVSHLYDVADVQFTIDCVGSSTD